MSKDQLRSQMKRKRSMLSFDEIYNRSQNIVDRLLKLDQVRSAKTFFIYVSYDQEVHTHDLIRELLRNKKIVTVPFIRTNGEEKEMIASQIHHVHDLHASVYGIPAPREDIEYRGDIDVIIAPGLAFTKDGIRLGQGGGFYDWFLFKHPDATSVGLAYDFQIVEHIPRESHDRQVSLVVTESGVYSAE